MFEQAAFLGMVSLSNHNLSQPQSQLEKKEAECNRLSMELPPFGDQFSDEWGNPPKITPQEYGKLQQRVINCQMELEAMRWRHQGPSKNKPVPTTPKDIRDLTYIPVESQDIRIQQEAQMTQNLQAKGMTADSQYSWNKVPTSRRGRPGIPTIPYGSFFNQGLTAAPVSMSPMASYGNYAGT